MAGAISISGISKSYKSESGPVRALDHVSLDVADGEIFGLLGPNGAGKTTLISILSGLTSPDSGHARVLGLDCTRQAKDVQQRINVISGFAGVPNTLTCEEALRYYGYLYAIDDAEAKIEEVMEKAQVTDFRDRLAYDLSSGMRQRLLIARGLLNDPEVLILDEPTVGLDVVSGIAVRELIKGLHREGRTILLTTHNMFEAEELCGRISFINHGKIIATGTPKELKKRIVGGREVEINCSSPKSVLSLLKGMEGVKARLHSTRLVHAEVDSYARIRDIMAALSGCTCDIYHIKELEPSLEETYLRFMDGDGDA